MAHNRYRAQRNYEDRPGEPAGKLPRIFRLDVDLVRRLDRLCEDGGLYPSHLVEVLLADSLRRLERGEIEVVKRPVMFELATVHRPDAVRTE